jgi:hypothetical protein
MAMQILGGGIQFSGGASFQSWTPLPIATAGATSSVSAQTNVAITSFSPFSSVTGATSPYTYSVSSGTLPTGITINSSTGLVSGTATAPQTSANVTFSVQDSLGAVSNTTVTVAFAVIATYGSLYGWGDNGYGQLGIGSTANTSSPVTVAGGGTTWKSISGGSVSAAAIKTDGTLWTWGYNYNSGLGSGSNSNRSSPGTTINGGTTWSQVSAGSAHMAAIKTDGTLWTCGYNNYGQLGNGGIIGAPGGQNSFATVSGGGTTWKQVATSSSNTVAIKTDGTLWTWGAGYFGVLGNGATGSGTDRSSPGTTAGGGTTWSQVAASNGSIGAIKTDGTLWMWGMDDYGQLGNGIVSGVTFYSSPSQTTGSNTTWKQIYGNAGGNYTFAAIKTDGTLWTWGRNDNAQCGVGNTTANITTPTQVAGGGTTWSSATTDYYHLAAVKTDGTLWTAGKNNYGQLGSGTTTDRSSLAQVGSSTLWSSVSGSLGIQHI